MGTPLGPRGIRASDQRANQAQEFLLLWPVTGREEKGSNLNIGDLATCGPGSLPPSFRVPSPRISSRLTATCSDHEFIASLGGAAAVCSRTRAAALPTDRPICNARVPQAIGQSFNWLVPAKVEVFGARVADRPAAFPLAELEQRASASVVDRDVFSRRLRPPERRHQHLTLGEDVQARTL